MLLKSLHVVKRIILRLCFGAPPRPKVYGRILGGGGVEASLNWDLKGYENKSNGRSRNFEKGGNLTDSETFF